MENFYTDNKDLKYHLNHPLMEKIVALKENNYKEADEFDYAPIDYEDAIDSYDKILEIVGEISGEVIEPNAESVDKEGPRLENNEVIYARGTQENHDVLTKAGLIGKSQMSGNSRTVQKPSMNLPAKRSSRNSCQGLTTGDPQPWCSPSRMPDQTFRLYS